MAKNDVKFIRVRGRVIPVKNKTGTKTVNKKRSVGERALSGFETGAKIGAATGAAVGFGTARFVGVPAGLAALLGTRLALKGAFNVGTLGAVGGAAFGSRKKKVKVKTKKKVAEF